MEIAAVGCCVCLCVSGLVALRWILVHREKKLAHAPISELQARIEGIEARILSSAMRR